MAINGGKFPHPPGNLGLQGLELTLRRGYTRLGLPKGFLEFPSLFVSELFFLGGGLLQLGGATLRFLQFGLQPGHFLLLFLELGLMRKIALFLFGCAEIAESECKN